MLILFTPEMALLLEANGFSNYFSLKAPHEQQWLSQSKIKPHCPTSKSSGLPLSKVLHFALSSLKKLSVSLVQILFMPHYPCCVFVGYSHQV